MPEKPSADVVDQTPDVTIADVLDTDTLLAELAALEPLEYDKRRSDAAKLLGVRVGTLDDAVRARRPPPAPGSGTGPASAEASALASWSVSGYRDRWMFDVAGQRWLTYGTRRAGIWSEYDHEALLGDIREAIHPWLPAGFSWRLLSDVGKFLETHLYSRVPSGPTDWLPCANGVIHLPTMQLHPHTPERHLTWALPYNYDPAATCPQTQRFLHEAVGGQCDQVQVLRAFGKAVVTRRVDLQRFLELIGPGGTGKGTFIRLLMALVGDENCFATELKHLETNRFELSGLVGKLLIAITDAERYGGAVDNLKAITGQDLLRVEEKYRRQRSAVADGLVVIAANEAIQSSDYTSGLARRRLTIYFRHRPSAPRDLLSTRAGVFQGVLVNELPGFLTWVLALSDAAVEALIGRTTAHVPSLASAWRHNLVETNPLAAWANTALVQVDKTAVNVGVARKIERSHRYEQEDTWLYPNYRAHIDATGGRALAANRFTSLLQDLFENQLRFAGVTYTSGRNGSQFHGIALRTTNRTTQAAPLLIVPEEDEKPFTSLLERMAGDGGCDGFRGGSDRCDGCDGLVQSFVQREGGIYPSDGVENFIKSHHACHSCHSSSNDAEKATAASHHQPSQAPPSLPAVGDLVIPLAADGSQIPDNGLPFPYLIRAIELGPDGQHYAIFVESDTGWPLAQCHKAPECHPVNTEEDC